MYRNGYIRKKIRKKCYIGIAINIIKLVVCLLKSSQESDMERVDRNYLLDMLILTEYNIL